MKAKKLAYQATKTNKTAENLAAFKRLKRKYKKEIKKAKTQHIQTLFTNAKSSLQFWKCVKEITGNTATCKIPDLETKDLKARTDKEKADLLSSTFEEAFQNPSLLHKPVTPENKDNWLPPCTEIFVLEKISSVPTRKAPRQYGITVRILKTLSNQVSSSVAMLINRSIIEGVFPDGWKHAIVSPIPKITNSTNTGHYRPISLLPIVSKITESHYFNALYPKINPKLHGEQFGFRKHRSTVDALTYFNIIVTDGMEKAGEIAAKPSTPYHTSR
uniref:Reverse transcriptase domain-containing protein n=1 Tax=Acrobeloides nanus TaxID=290746 RepID=A0A914C3M2_9BILA